MRRQYGDEVIISYIHTSSPLLTHIIALYDTDHHPTIQRIVEDCVSEPVSAGLALGWAFFAIHENKTGK